MKKSQITEGGIYIAKVSNRLVRVRVDAIAENRAGKTIYHVMNLATGRQLQFRSGAKFRRRACDVDAAGQVERTATSYWHDRTDDRPAMVAVTADRCYVSNDGRYIGERLGPGNWTLMDLTDDVSIRCASWSMCREVSRTRLARTKRRQESKDEADDAKFDRDKAHAEKFRVLLTDRIAAELKTYISEAQHGDGYAYWRNFENTEQALHDFGLYLKVAHEDSVPDEPTPQL